MTDEHGPGGGSLEDAAEALRALLAAQDLSAEARARHLFALRERAVLLGPARGRPRRRVAAGLARRVAATVSAGGLVLTLGSGVAVAASAGTVPGQPLYQVKLLTEQARLALPESPAGEVAIRLRLAERRLEEAETLRRRGGADVDERLAQALLAYEELAADAAAVAGADGALQARVRSAAAVAQGRLESLLAGGLPPRAAQLARQALEGARQRLDDQPPTDAPPPAGPAADPTRAPTPAERPGPPEAPGTRAEPGPRGQPGAPSEAPGPAREPARPQQPVQPDEPGRGQAPAPPAQPGPGQAPAPPAQPGPGKEPAPPAQPGRGKEPGAPQGRGRPDDAGPPPGAGPPQGPPAEPTESPTEGEESLGLEPFTRSTTRTPRTERRARADGHDGNDQARLPARG